MLDDQMEAARGHARRQRPVMLKDVAELANVHISTASRALDPVHSQRVSAATVIRVEAAAARLGYTPHLGAAGLKRRRTNSVGIVVSDLENPYSALLIRGVSMVMEERGFVPLVTETIEDRRRLERTLRHLMSRRVDAIVTSAMRVGEEELLEAVRDAGIPVVLTGRGLPGSGFPAVLHDDLGGGALAAEHLLELGHRVVAQLLGPADIDTFDRRRRGFESRTQRPDVVDMSLPVHSSAPSLEEGRRLMELVLRTSPRPTGIFAHNDLMAVGAMEALATAGLRCPDDVSIVGYNDQPLSAHLSPPLTTIRNPMEELGRDAGRIALQLIDDPGSRAEDIELPATLIARGSSCPVAAR